MGGLIFLNTRQYVGDMQGADLVSLIADIPIQVHEAGKICRNDIIDPCLQGIVYFLVGHSNGNRLEFNGKTSPETTAGLHIVHLHQLQSLYMAQQLPRLLFDLTFPEPRTGIMIGGLSVKARPHVLHAQGVDHELGKLENSFLKIFYGIMKGGIIEEGGIIVPDKTHAGCTGHYNGIASRKIFDELGADFPRLIPETGIEGRLTTAGLIGIVFHLDPRPLQHLYHVEGCLRIKLIDKTWYE